jgi:hypothetical protein
MQERRWATFVLFGLGAAVLGGCPIYPDSPDHTVCLQDGTCYSCPNDYYSSDCFSYACSWSNDCPNGYTCDARGKCVSGQSVYDGGASDSAPACSTPSGCPSGYTCGVDGTCHWGDCAATGCPSGYQCKLSGGVLQCVGGAAPDAGGIGTDGGTFTGCHNDLECPTPAGSKCLNGACVAPQDQCFDPLQCPYDEQCVAGVCTPSCATGCPAGFSCDSKTNVCSGNPTPCGATADGGACAGGGVCVEDHCVAPCSAGDTCPTGQVCIAGGCIPDQKPRFACTTEGTQDACRADSICIHHACYLACDADAGPDACKKADAFNVCKSVTTASGTYSVCGSASSGTGCDPTKPCPGTGVCIDGVCR